MLWNLSSIVHFVKMMVSKEKSMKRLFTKHTSHAPISMGKLGLNWVTHLLFFRQRRQIKCYNATITESKKIKSNWEGRHLKFPLTMRGAHQVTSFSNRWMCFINALHRSQFQNGIFKARFGVVDFWDFCMSALSVQNKLWKLIK